MAEADTTYLSHFLQFVQHAKSARVPVRIAGEMCYSQAKNTVVCIEPPVYRRVAPAVYATPPASLYTDRESILWGDKAATHKLIEDYTRAFKEAAKAAEERVAQDGEAADLGTKRQQAVFLETAALGEYARVQAASREKAAAIADPVERSKAWLSMLALSKDFDAAKHTRALRTAQAMQSMPAYVETQPARITKKDGKKKGVVAAAPPAPEQPEPHPPAPVVYVESDSAPPVPVIVQAPMTSKSSKEKAKRQWVSDALASTGFTFKTAEECASKRRLAEHYMSKDDLLRVLAQNPEVTAQMPQHYLKATKEELCGYLFKEPV